MLFPRRWFFIAVAISARVLPPYGRLAAKEQMLEGRFRAKHAKLIQNGEMVAFMRARRLEKSRTPTIKLSCQIFFTILHPDFQKTNGDLPGNLLSES